MTVLSLLLWIKILVTLFWVALPLLVLPKAMIERLSGFESSDRAIYRLYAVAIIALLAGYFGGYLQLIDGEYPYDVLVMGIVSNAGAFFTLLVTKRAKKTPIMAAFFGLIAVGLTVSAAFEGLGRTTLWA